MKKSTGRPAYIRRLDEAIQREKANRGTTLAPGARVSGYEIDWVLVDEDPASSADRHFLRGQWTRGKTYKVRGIVDNMNVWRRDLIFVLADDVGRLYHVHMDHVRCLEGEE